MGHIVNRLCSHSSARVDHSNLEQPWWMVTRIRPALFSSSGNCRSARLGRSQVQMAAISRMDVGKCREVSEEITFD